MSQKTALKTRSMSDTSPKDVTNEVNPVHEWRFKVTGRGTSGWMSWVWEGSKEGQPGGGAWCPLRPSETSFVSAIAAIEPEIMRLAFPHKAVQKVKP